MSIKSNQEFLNILFGPNINDMWVTDHHDWAGGFAPAKLSTLDPNEANYFAAARIKLGSFARSNKTFQSGVVIVLDDVGTKYPLDSALNFAPTPTYKIMTSRDNEQWGYVLIDAVEDPHKWHAFYEMLRKGPYAPAADNSGLAAYKRLPFGLASKSDKRGYKTHLTHWEPDVRYHFDDLAKLFGLDLSPQAIALSGVRMPRLEDMSAEPMSQDMLEAAIKVIPNDDHFERRQDWLDVGFAIYGASGGAPWGRDLWLEWSYQVGQRPREPENFWDTLKPKLVRMGAGFIRKQLERVGAIELYTKAKLEAIGFFNETGQSFDDSDTPHTGGPRKKKALLRKGSSIKPLAISWLWNGFLAKGKLHLLAGNAKTGKTTTALKLAALLSQGEPWPDGQPGIKGNILIWSGEDGVDDTLVPRLILSGANMDSVHFIEGVQDGEKETPFDPSKDMGTLAETIDEIGGVDLLIIDPIMSAVGGDSSAPNDVRRSLQPIVDLADRYKAAVIGITHFTKSTSGKSAMNAILGSQAFAAVARVIFFCFAKTDPETAKITERVFVRGQSNIGPDGDAFKYTIDVGKLINEEDGEIIINTSAVFGDIINASADTLLTELNGGGKGAEPEGPGRPPVERARAEDYLRQALKNGPRAAEELFEEAENVWDITRATLKNAKKSVGLNVFKDQKNKNVWTWNWPIEDEKDEKPS